MKRNLTVAALAALSFAAAPALGDAIYKHVDADGTVIYRDRPSGEVGEEIVATYKRTNNANVQSATERRQQYVDSMNERREAREAKDAEQAQAAVDASERAAKCQENRDRLESYLQSRRLYRESADGEREYLDDSEALAARQQVEELIKEYCS